MHSVPLPGNQEYKVKFIPLSLDARDSLKPLSFQIQLKEHEFLSRKFIIKQSMAVIMEHMPSFQFDLDHIEIYEEMANGKYAMLIQFNEENGLHDEKHPILLIEHPLFAHLDDKPPNNVVPLPVHFQSTYAFNSINEHILFPFR